jgi:hypothetical protein
LYYVLRLPSQNHGNSIVSADSHQCC